MIFHKNKRYTRHAVRVTLMLPYILNAETSSPHPESQFFAKEGPTSVPRCVIMVRLLESVF